MDEKLKQSFPLITENHCLKIISAIRFYVYDDPDTDQICFTDQEPDEYQNFRIENPDNKPIRFLAVDHCLFFDDGPKKCDFILYDESVFCFIELKGVKKRKRKNAKREAEEQILTTVELFQEKLESFKGRILEAYLCVGYRTGRPSTLSRSQRAKRDFARINVKLYDGCRREFQL